MIIDYIVQPTREYITVTRTSPALTYAPVIADPSLSTPQLMVEAKRAFYAFNTFKFNRSSNLVTFADDDNGLPIEWASKIKVNVQLTTTAGGRQMYDRKQDLQCLLRFQRLKEVTVFLMLPLYEGRGHLFYHKSRLQLLAGIIKSLRKSEKGVKVRVMELGSTYRVALANGRRHHISSQPYKNDISDWWDDPSDEELSMSIRNWKKALSRNYEAPASTMRVLMARWASLRKRTGIMDYIDMDTRDNSTVDTHWD